MRGRGQGYAILIIASLVATGLCMPALYAANNHGYPIDSSFPSLNYTLHNGTLPNASMQGEYGTTPAPVTIYHFELDQASLPGPRYMAYGPGVIALAIDPRLLAVLIALCAIIAGAWYLRQRKREDETEK